MNGISLLRNNVTSFEFLILSVVIELQYKIYHINGLRKKKKRNAKN